MGRKVTAQDRDRLTAAQIAAITRRHARGRPLTDGEETAALEELAEVAAGRADLLAQQAGLALGFHEADADAAVYRQVAQLCIRAGADTALISRWIDEGRRRAAAAKQIPFGGLAPPATGHWSPVAGEGRAGGQAAAHGKGADRHEPNFARIPWPAAA
jgi:hypothetical protein